jgi:hypothetical protein
MNKHTMVIPLAVLLVVAACTSGTPPPDWGATIAKAHGGDGFGKDRVRFLRFDFVVRKGGETKAVFRHLLDRVTGDYRYEADAATFAGVPFLDETTRSWKPIGLDLPTGRLVALGNRDRRTGRVWIDGREQPAGLADRVRQRVDNDSWWLVLPLVLAAPNLEVASEGPAEVEGIGEAQRLTLTFRPGSGDTPGDVYRLYVDPGSYRMLRTEIDLQNRDATVEANWHEEIVSRGLRFHGERRMKDKTLAFENLALPDEVPERVFEDPAVEM